MGRTANKGLAPVESAPLNEEALAESQNLLGSIAQGLHDERDLVNQLLGQVQMANAIARFSDVVGLTKLQFIKENKLYRALKGKKAFAPDGSEISDVGTFEGFCQALGLSYSKVHEDLQNLATFGEEALKQLTAVGAGYRELRQYRRLPEDEKTALIEAARSGDKDTFIDLAEEIIAKHHKEKADLSKRLDEVNGDYDAQGEVLAKKSNELNDTKVELEKARRRIQHQPLEQAVKELRMEVVAITTASESEIQVNLREGFGKLLQQAEEHGQDHRPFMAMQLRQIEIALTRIRNDFDLESDDGEAAPSWMTADALLPTAESAAEA